MCAFPFGVVSSDSESGKERAGEEELTPALSSAEVGGEGVLCGADPQAVAGKISALPTAPYFPFTLCGVDKRPRQRCVGSWVWFAECLSIPAQNGSTQSWAVPSPVPKAVGPFAAQTRCFGGSCWAVTSWMSLERDALGWAGAFWWCPRLSQWDSRAGPGRVVALSLQPDVAQQDGDCGSCLGCSCCSSWSLLEG